MNNDHVSLVDDCPFPDVYCRDIDGNPSCPFFQRGNGCVWKDKIKPHYKRERLAKDLANNAVQRLDIDDIFKQAETFLHRAITQMEDDDPEKPKKKKEKKKHG